MDSSSKPTCQFRKEDSATCKRSVSAREKYCWQHAHSLRSKWKSLTRNQTLLFVGTIATLLALPIGVASWLHPAPSKEEIAKEVVRNLPPPPVKREVEKGLQENLKTEDKVKVEVHRGNLPTTNVPPVQKSGTYELTNEQRERLVKRLSAQTAPRDTLRIGCTSWSETSCLAAGRFLLVFSEAGWQIEENKVFRLEPQIPIVGIAMAAHTPADEPKDPLPPHLGRWRVMDESRKTIYWALQLLNIPVSGATDDTLKDGTIGIYFGSEPK